MSLLRLGYKSCDLVLLAFSFISSLLLDLMNRYHVVRWLMKWFKGTEFGESSRQVLMRIWGVNSTIQRQWILPTATCVSRKQNFLCGAIIDCRNVKDPEPQELAKTISQTSIDNLHLTWNLSISFNLSNLLA